jgi:hypothetical protein
VDSCATALFALLLAGEAAADYQQLVYQTEKYRRRAAREPAGAYARGFIETGLWSWSRWVHGDTLPSRLYCVARCCTGLQGVVAAAARTLHAPELSSAQWPTLHSADG